MSTAMKSVIVGTAGHIDHGKSTLVEALTGTHPDRLAEEKRRGITIDLGFAFLEENGVRFGFVDVPGRSEEHTSELQSHSDLVCRLLLEKKKKRTESALSRTCPRMRVHAAQTASQVTSR